MVARLVGPARCRVPILTLVGVAFVPSPVPTNPVPPAPNVGGLYAAAMLFFVAAWLLALAPESFFIGIAAVSGFGGLILLTRKKAAWAIAMFLAFAGFVAGVVAAASFSAREIGSHATVVLAVLVSVVILALMGTRGVRAACGFGIPPASRQESHAPAPEPWPGLVKAPQPMPVPPPVPTPAPPPVEALPASMVASPLPSGSRDPPVPAPQLPSSRDQVRARLTARLQGLSTEISSLVGKRVPDQQKLEQARKNLSAARGRLEEEQYRPDPEALDSTGHELDAVARLLDEVRQGDEARAGLTQELASVEKELAALVVWSTVDVTEVKTEVQQARAALRANDVDGTRSRLAVATEAIRKAAAAAAPEVSFSPDLRAFVKGRWEDYTVKITNRGTGPASEIRPELAIEDSRIRPLAEGKSFKANPGQTIAVPIPVNFGADGKVPLSITVTWKDREGRSFSAVNEYRAEVRPG